MAPDQQRAAAFTLAAKIRKAAARVGDASAQSGDDFAHELLEISETLAELQEECDVLAGRLTGDPAAVDRIAAE